MTFSEALKQHHDRLTRAQRQMAAYIFDHEDEVAFMTAKQLGDAAGQSDAAVVRFAKAVGFSGFNALRESLRVTLVERVGASGLAQRVTGSPEEELKAEVFGTEATLAQQTAQLNPDAAVSAVVDSVVAARRVFVTGHGTTFALAAYLAMQMNYGLGKGEVFNIEHGDVGDRMRSVGPQDVFIGIGYLRYLSYTVDILRGARASGAHVVAITDRVTSPLAALAHQTLFVARGHRSAAWWSQAGTLALADWLVVLAMHRDSVTAVDQLRAGDEQLKRLGHWQGGDERIEEPVKTHLLNSKRRPKKAR
ncbi:MurR/RpiR family transcriptional regulator [Bradyrhizobium sp. RT11b]|uniref:MurR/RpiR family transcriptional regulator n=1 Tax=Bradyrhizobium sp. RT11b TaxID=3156332 RepID=UPI00339B453B